jgi:PAS domain S-box-containing protein
MFSTHHNAPHRPDERGFGLLGLLARQASDLIEQAQAEEKLNQLNATLERRVAARTEELTRVNQLLKSSEQALADFFSEAPLGLLWLAPDGHIVRANQAQAALLDRQLDELSGRNITEFCTNKEVASALLRELAQGKSIHEHPLQVLRPDGSSRHVLVDANGAWQDRELTHSRWFLRDVSQRVELEREILAAGERVRRQIGHDLHDDLCQQLTSIEYLGRALERQLGANFQVGAQRAREIGSLTRKAIAYTRELSHTMSPMELATDGLPEALKNLAKRIKRLFHIDCRFRGDSHVLLDDTTVQTNLYRIAQEATQNAVKHGKAQFIEIGLAEKLGNIVLTVRDNGVGLPFKTCKAKGFGLRIMDYRARALGGCLKVTKPKSGGTTLICSIPKSLVALQKQQLNQIYVR